MKHFKEVQKKCGVSDLRIESNKFISNQLCLKNAGEKCDFHSNCKSNYCFGKVCCSNDMLDNKFNLKPQFKDCSKCNKNTCEECIGGKFENNSCPKQNCNKVYQKDEVKVLTFNLLYGGMQIFKPYKGYPIIQDRYTILGNFSTLKAG